MAIAMRVGSCCQQQLAILEGLGATQPSGPLLGYDDFEKMKNDVLVAAVTEPDQVKKQLLTKAATIAAAALTIPVAGWIVAGATAALALFGITIRGATQHVNETEAGQKGQEFFDTKIRPMYNGLPADAKAKMIEFVANWQANMFNTFHDWWGNMPPGNPPPVTALYALWNRQFGYPAPTDITAWVRILQNNEPDNIGGIIVNWFRIIMHWADADSVNDNMGAWYFDRLGDIVFKPLDAYMVEKYNQTVAQYEALGGNAVSQVSTAGIGTLIGIGALALPFLFFKGKGA